MKVLVTGANGYIGSRVCIHFLHKQYKVSALVRKQSDLSLLNEINVNLVNGDITQPESIEGICEGIDLLVHTAAAVTDWGPYKHFEKTNLEGTQNIAREAEKSGVKRMVHISSVAVHGFGFKHKDESNEPTSIAQAYSESKRQTEIWLKEFSKESKMEIVIIRPGNVFGPHDEKFIKPYLDLLSKGRFMYVGKGKSITCPTYIENLVHGIDLASVHPKAAGEIFNITDGLEISWRQFTEALYDELKLNPTDRSVPYKLVYLVSALMELIYKMLLIDRAPILTRYRIKNAGKDYHFSIEKAKQILDYKPVVDFETSIQKTVAWYIHKYHPKN